MMGSVSPESSSHWASLPIHLLDSIMEKLIYLPDLVRFAVVCTPWFSAATTNNQLKKKQRKQVHKQIPMLIVPPSSASKDNRSEDEEEEGKRSLYGISRNKLYDFQLSLSSYKLRFCGSSHGWLAAVENNYAITLINPFSGVSSITLPPLMQVDDSWDFTDYEYDIHKVVLSADPSLAPDTFQAAAIHGDCDLLALIKSGDKAWTYIGRDQLNLVTDVVYYESQFHALTRWDGLASIVGHMHELNTIIEGSSREQITSSYLVESTAGELLKVERFWEVKDDPFQKMTCDFDVYKLSHPNGRSAGPSVWVEFEGDIGGDALFIGDNHSFSVVASQFPGCLPNSIYYSDDFTEIVRYKPFGPRDMAIFSVEDYTFRLHYTPNPSHKDMPPPIWIVPTLQGKLGLN